MPSVKRRSVHDHHGHGERGRQSSTTNHISVGDRVDLPARSHINCGTVRFVGFTRFAPGEWCGIELDQAWGKNNGSVQGKEYFRCAPRHGLFVRSFQCRRHIEGRPMSSASQSSRAATPVTPAPAQPPLAASGNPALPPSVPAPPEAAMARTVHAMPDAGTSQTAPAAPEPAVVRTAPASSPAVAAAVATSAALTAAAPDPALAAVTAPAQPAATQGADRTLLQRTRDVLERSRAPPPTLPSWTQLVNEAATAQQTAAHAPEAAAATAVPVMVDHQQYQQPPQQQQPQEPQQPQDVPVASVVGAQQQSIASAAQGAAVTAPATPQPKSMAPQPAAAPVVVAPGPSVATAVAAAGVPSSVPIARVVSAPSAVPQPAPRTVQLQADAGTTASPMTAITSAFAELEAQNAKLAADVRRLTQVDLGGRGRLKTPTASPRGMGRHASPTTSPRGMGRHASPTTSPRGMGRHSSVDVPLSPARSTRSSRSRQSARSRRGAAPAAVVSPRSHARASPRAVRHGRPSRGKRSSTRRSPARAGVDVRSPRRGLGAGVASPKPPAATVHTLGGWTMEWDDEWDRQYYFNVDSGESLWVKPAHLHGVPDAQIQRATQLYRAQHPTWVSPSPQTSPPLVDSPGGDRRSPRTSQRRTQLQPASPHKRSSEFTGNQQQAADAASVDTHDDAEGSAYDDGALTDRRRRDVRTLGATGDATSMTGDEYAGDEFSASDEDDGAAGFPLQPSPTPARRVSSSPRGRHRPPLVSPPPHARARGSASSHTRGASFSPALDTAAPAREGNAQMSGARPGGNAHMSGARPGGNAHMSGARQEGYPGVKSTSRDGHLKSSRRKGDSGPDDNGLDGTVAGLEAEVRMLRAQVAQLQEEKREAAASTRALKQAFHKNAGVLQSQIEQWREAASEGSGQAGKLTQRMQELDARCTRLEAQLVQSQKEAAQLKADKHELEAECRKLQADNEAAAVSRMVLQGQVDSLTTRLQDAKAAAAASDATATNASDLIRNAETKRDIAERATKTATTEMQEAVRQRDELAEQLESVLEELHDAQHASEPLVQGLKQQVQDAESTATALRGDLAAAEAEIEQLQAQVASASRDERQAADTEAALQSANGMVDALRQQVAQEAARAEAAEGELRELRQQVDDTSAVDALKQEHDAALAEARKALTRAQRREQDAIADSKDQAAEWAAQLRAKEEAETELQAELSDLRDKVDGSAADLRALRVAVQRIYAATTAADTDTFAGATVPALIKSLHAVHAQVLLSRKQASQHAAAASRHQRRLQVLQQRFDALAASGFGAEAGSDRLAPGSSAFDRGDDDTVASSDGEGAPVASNEDEGAPLASNEDEGARLTSSDGGPAVRGGEPQLSRTAGVDDDGTSTATGPGGDACDSSTAGRASPTCAEQEPPNEAPAENGNAGELGAEDDWDGVAHRLFDDMNNGEQEVVVDGEQEVVANEDIEEEEEEEDEVEEEGRGSLSEVEQDANGTDAEVDTASPKSLEQLHVEDDSLNVDSPILVPAPGSPDAAEEGVSAPIQVKPPVVFEVTTAPEVTATRAAALERRRNEFAARMRQRERSRKPRKGVPVANGRERATAAPGTSSTRRAAAAAPGAKSKRRAKTPGRARATRASVGGRPAAASTPGSASRRSTSAMPRRRSNPRIDALATPQSHPKRATAPKSTKAVRLSNHQRLRRALTAVCLAGPHLETRRQIALDMLQSRKDSNCVLLFWDGKPVTSNAIYALNEDLSRGVRVYGSGPVILRPSLVTAYFKYDSASRQFKRLSTNRFTVTTDAVSIAASHRPRREASSAGTTASARSKS